MREGLIALHAASREETVTGSVAAWQQAGRLYVWRYSAPSRSRKGWHFTADPAGCNSVIDLIARMVGEAAPCHRTLRLHAITPAIWGVPNFGPPKRDRLEKLRLQYDPAEVALSLSEIDERLTLRLGEKQSSSLSAAFADVSVGLGDFGIATSDEKRPEVWMFWWMPQR